VQADNETATAQNWTPILRGYRDADHARSLLEIALTLVPFVLLWLAMLASLQVSYLLTLVLALPTAGFLVRLFMIQHDCGHGSFFRSRIINDCVGRFLSVLTLTPYSHWRESHAIHHATSGKLDQRGIGDIDTLTVAEYRGLSRWGRLRYRLYRHPLVMFGVGPAYVFLLQNRVPSGRFWATRRAWVSALTTNLAIATASFGVMWLVGVVPFLLIHLPVTVLAASIGVWLFFVQHQFEDTYWDWKPDWSHHDAALHGSSHYVLPAWLQWMTANIGIHHVHHLSSGIPFYRLPAVLKDHPALAEAGRMTLMESLQCVKLTLWDEAERRLISFDEFRRREGQRAGAAMAA
jgi:omega-6 fatty acid desaturase (delta-12 desaturase)